MKVVTLKRGEYVKSERGTLVMVGTRGRGAVLLEFIHPSVTDIQMKRQVKKTRRDMVEEKRLERAIKHRASHDA